MSTYAFVDGEYLRRRFETVMTGLYGTVPDIDYSRVVGGDRIFYYDAVDEQQEGETADDYSRRVAPRKALHQYINRLRNWHVREGYVRRNPKKGQKAVDILLAVDALEHAARGNMNQATLVAGDLDFEPLVKSLVRLGVRVTVFCSVLSVAPELLDAADETVVLSAV